MNTIDYIFLVIVGLSMIYSIIKGFVREIFSIVGIIAGLVLAGVGYAKFSQALLPILHNKTASTIASFVVIFIAIAATIITVGIFIERLVKFVKLNWINRTIGGLFGFLKGILIFGIICLVILTFVPKGSDWLKGSAFAIPVLHIMEYVTNLLPEDLKKEFEDKFETLKEVLPQS